MNVYRSFDATVVFGILGDCFQAPGVMFDIALMEIIIIIIAIALLWFCLHDRLSSFLVSS